MKRPSTCLPWCPAAGRRRLLQPPTAACSNLLHRSCLLQPPTVVVGSRVGRTRQQGWRSQRWEQGGGSGRSKLEEEEATGAGCRPATSVAVWWAQEKG